MYNNIFNLLIIVLLKIWLTERLQNIRFRVKFPELQIPPPHPTSHTHAEGGQYKSVSCSFQKGEFFK